jgi:hypothetical protein
MLDFNKFHQVCIVGGREIGDSKKIVNRKIQFLIISSQKIPKSPNVQTKNSNFFSLDIFASVLGWDTWP